MSYFKKGTVYTSNSSYSGFSDATRVVSQSNIRLKDVINNSPKVRSSLHKLKG